MIVRTTSNTVPPTGTPTNTEKGSPDGISVGWTVWVGTDEREEEEMTAVGMTEMLLVCVSHLSSSGMTAQSGCERELGIVRELTVGRSI